MITQLVVLGFAMGMNNALASVALGSMKMRRWHQLRTALVFAVFEAAMPLIGVLAGEELAGLIGTKARFIGIGVLVLAGLYSLFKKGDGDSENPQRGLGLKTIMLAVALSLDNLTVGFGLGMFKIPLGLAAVVFGTVSLGMTLVGLEIGRYLGNRMSVSSDKLSGVVLLVTAGLMLIH